MNRFELLSILSSVNSELSVSEIAARAGNPTRRFEKQVRVQLNRLHRWGLVLRGVDRWSYAKRHGFGLLTYRISAKGKERIRWKKNNP